MTKDKTPDTDTSSAGAEGARNQPGALGLLLPPDRAVWAEARRLVGNKNIRVEDLAICAAQDPIIVIELLRIANAMFFSGGRSPITSAKSAIIRLGSDVVLETLDKIGERPDTEDPKVSVYVEEHRQRAKRFSIVATILSEALARNLTEDAQTSALFASMGELLAAAFFKKTYVELAAGNSRSSLHYRLVQDHKFDCEKMGVLYLRRNGIPEAILFALDRQAASRVPERAILRPLCQAAVEMCDAFDGKRWEKLAPGKPIQPKSAIRMLQIPDAQYLKIYERASEYLFSAKVIEDMRREGGAPRPAATSPAPASTGDSRAELDSEIGALVKGVGVEFEEELAPPQPPSSRAASPGERAAQVKVAGAVKGVVESRDVLDQFGLSGAKAQPKKVARSNDVKLVEPPVIHTPNGTTIVTAITDSFENATRSEDLLAGLLQALVDKGPFEKSALIVVSKDRRSAVVVAARGPNIGNGQKLSLDDPLSPLAQCFSKVQSFGNKESPTSPFGSKAFALSPIDADHDTPVALYADCGNSGSLSFEARRIFRTVVDVLNQKLPSIPGGIPVEISVS